MLFVFVQSRDRYIGCNRGSTNISIDELTNDNKQLYQIIILDPQKI